MTTVMTNIKSVRKLFKGDRPGGWYVPGIAGVASIVTVAILLWVLPGSAITSWSLTGDVGPISEAGGLAQPVIGFFQFGVVRIYIPLLSILFVAGGELAAMSLARFKIPIAVVAGAGAGVQPVVVSGCGCGYGTAGRAMSLLEQAVAVGLL